MNLKKIPPFVLALLAAGCGSSPTPDDATTPPSRSAASAETPPNVPPATSDVDSRKPYAQRGDK